MLETRLWRPPSQLYVADSPWPWPVLFCFKDLEARGSRGLWALYRLGSSLPPRFSRTWRRWHQPRADGGIAEAAAVRSVIPAGARAAGCCISCSVAPSRRSRAAVLACARSGVMLGRARHGLGLQCSAEGSRPGSDGRPHRTPTVCGARSRDPWTAIAKPGTVSTPGRTSPWPRRPRVPWGRQAHGLPCRLRQPA